jgi:acetyl-CoA synthetase
MELVGEPSSAFCWTPTPEQRDRANVSRLMRRFGIDTLAELHARSVEEPSWFWAAVVEDLGIEFFRPWAQVVDTSGGPEWSRWFTGGLVNVAHNCVYRHARGNRASQPSIIWEGEDGSVRCLSYGELSDAVSRLAGALDALGARRGDRVGLYLPMLPEALVTFFACATLGLVTVPIFSGFGAEAVASRLKDSGTRILVTADGFLRRGKAYPMKEIAAASASAAGVEKMLVVRRLGGLCPWNRDRDVWFHDAIESAAPMTAVPLDPEAPLLIAYTSGTTGRPKGVVHVHGGFLVKVTEEFAYQLDVRPDDRLHWVTDMGWIVGPWQATAVCCLGATLVLHEGAPDHPAPDRLWCLVERHDITCLGLSPTLVRTLRARGNQFPGSHDRSSLRMLYTTGEPIDGASYRWLSDVVGDGRVPVINVSGGTEVGACFLAPHPVEPLKPTSLQGPALGMAMDVWGDNGKPVAPGEVGHLVCRRPWPSITRGFWNDRERYLDTYWRRWPGVWFHGDWAYRDADGHWYILGRSDDTLNVAGKRLGPAEVESVLAVHEAVAESAAVGIPDPIKGQTIWCYCVVRDSATVGDALRQELSDLIVASLGAPFRPGKVWFVEALPKTRSAKVMRRVIQAVACRDDPGDLSSLEDPTALEAIRAAH